MDFLKELENFMEEEINLNETDSGEEYKITTEAEANEIVRRIKYFEDNINNRNRLADAEKEKYINMIENFRNDSNRKDLDKINYYTHILREYVEKELEGKKKRSITLPFGKVSLKKQQNKVEYDDKVLLSFLKEHEGFNNFIKVDIKESVNKSELKKNMVVDVTTGDVYVNNLCIEGMKSYEQEDKMTIS